MPSNLVLVKDYLGKYYPELFQSTLQPKYVNSALGGLFEQRFRMQDNKLQMVVQPGISDLNIVIDGNEVFISERLYNHPSVIIRNSIEVIDKLRATPYKARYNPDIVQTLAYLVCQNIIDIDVKGNLDEPIYISYIAEYETFQNSVLSVNIHQNVVAEIVEEIDSRCVINAVINYTVAADSRLSHRVFYSSSDSGISAIYRNFLVNSGAILNQVVFGVGTTLALDENNVRCYNYSMAEFLGVINSRENHFRSVFSVDAATSPKAWISANYKNIMNRGVVDFLPFIPSTFSPGRNFAVESSSIDLTKISPETKIASISDYTSQMHEASNLKSTNSVKRFVDSRTQFFDLL